MSYVFFFNDTATTEIYTLSLHDALPIWLRSASSDERRVSAPVRDKTDPRAAAVTGTDPLDSFRQILTGRRKDRKSTRLNSSHANISYAVFCLKNKIRLG